MPNYRSAAEAQPSLEKIGRYLEEAGRRWEEIGLEPRLRYGSGTVDDWHRQSSEWRSVGVTHLPLNTMHCGLETPAAHISPMEAFAGAALE